MARLEGSDLASIYVSDGWMVMIQQSALACLLARTCHPQQVHANHPYKTVCLDTNHVERKAQFRDSEFLFGPRDTCVSLHLKSGVFS